MASCDDDFSLLGDDNAQSSNPNLVHHHHHHHHHVAAPHPQPQAFTHRYPSKSTPIHAPPPSSAPSVLPSTAGGGSPNKTAGGEGDGGENYSDGAFCSQVDPKCASSYHEVAPFTDNDSNPFDNESDPNKSRANTSNEKRKDREELSDGGTPYSYKKSKLSSAGGGGGASSAPGSAEYRKDREEWSDTAIACLLDAYTEKFTQLNRGNLRGRDWEEVAAIVSERCEKQTKSVEQCKNKVDNLKKRYKLERHRMNNAGVSASHWPWFKKMELIVGNSLPSGSKAVSEDDKVVVGSSNSLRQSKRYEFVVG